MPGLAPRPGPRPAGVSHPGGLDQALRPGRDVRFAVTCCGVVWCGVLWFSLVSGRLGLAVSPKG